MASPIFALALVAATPPSATATATATAAPGRAVVYRVAPDDPDTAGRRILRGVLFLPRLAVRTLLLPIEGLLWVSETYEVQELALNLFFNEDRTVGAYPTFAAESGFGPNLGLTLIARDLLDHDAEASLSGSFGGRDQASVEGRVHTGRLISDHFRIGAHGIYENRPRELFFGLGPDPGEEEIRLQRIRTRGDGWLEVRAADTFRARLTGLYADIEIDRSDEDPNASLDAFEPRTELFMQQLLLEVDTRRAPDPFVPPSKAYTGFYVGGTVALTEVISEPEVVYPRASLDLRYLIPLGLPTRVLRLRAFTESIFASERVPTVELPRLGGPRNLRGYLRDRFRDESSVLFSAEYRFPVVPVLRGYLFVDTGRVFGGYEDFGLEDWRLGFGGGIELLGPSRVLGRFQVGGSKDGDVVFNFVLSPDFRIEPRTER